MVKFTSGADYLCEYIIGADEFTDDSASEIIKRHSDGGNNGKYE